MQTPKLNQLSPLKRHATLAITLLQTKKITELARLGDLDGALHLFDQMPHRNQVTYNAMLSALLRAGCLHPALHLFDQMPTKNPTSYTTLIAALSRAGLVRRARHLFDSVPITQRNVFSWTAMLSCYVRNGCPAHALNLFRHHYGRFFESGVLPNEHTFSALLNACGSIICKLISRQIHCLSMKLLDWEREESVFVCNCLIDVYAKMGCLAEAEAICSRMKHKDLATVNTMMDAYTFHLLIDKALDIFHSIEKKDALSWNIVMSGLLDARRGEEALKLFACLLRSEEEAKPNPSSYTIVLSSCAALTRIEFGRQVHAMVVRNGLYGSNTYVTNSLITMYASSGLSKESERVFDEMPVKDVISWNSVIQGLGQNGHARKALEIAEIALSSKIYNGNTFIAILTSCSHGGIVAKGLEYLNCMSAKYGVEPSSDHYICMIDMLGRAGDLQAAHGLLCERGLDSNPVALATLLNACIIHEDSQIGEAVAEKLRVLEPDSVRSYLAMASVYSRTARVEESKRLLDSLRNKELRKNPGRSWIVQT